MVRAVVDAESWNSTREGGWKRKGGEIAYLDFLLLLPRTRGKASLQRETNTN